MNTLNISDIILLANYFNVCTISNLNKIIESYNVGTMKPDEAWKIHKGKLIEKFKTDDSAPKDASSLPQEFIEADPTIEKTYLEWIISSYLRGGIKRFEDIASRTGPALKKYEYLKKNKTLPKIEQFCGIVGCEKIVKKRNKKGEMKDEEIQIPGLEDYLGGFTDELKTFEIEYKVETKEYEKLVEDDEVLIVHPLTEQASCRYGKGTKWCVSADEGNMFEHYNKDGPLYMFIPKKKQYASEKYAIHINTENFMDEKDNPIKLDWLFQTRFPDLLKAKDKTSKEYKFIKKLWEESKDKDFNLLFVPEDEQTRGMILKAIKQNWIALQFASETFRNDKDIVLAAVKQNWIALKYTSEEFKNDKDIVLAAIEQDGHALEYASEELQNNKDIVLEAVKQYGYSSEELRNKDIVLATIKRDGRALKYTSEKFKNNKEIVLAAVKKDGRALEYASEKLQNNKDIVLAAVKQNGFALEYASENLQNNKKIVLAAVKQNGFALQFASEKLKNDKEILAVVK